MPDRPGEPGPDVTEGRGTRTSTSEGTPAGKGPKRPGSPSPRTAAGSNGSGGQRPRTGSGAAKRSKGSGSPQTAPPGKRSKGPKATAPDGAAKRTARPARATKPGSSATDGTATPRMAAEGSATDPTTEITGLDEGRATRPPRQRTRRNTTQATDPALSSNASPDLDHPVEERRTRARTTPAVRRGRRVKRVIRRIELWSVLKLAIVLYTCMYLAVLLTVVVIWGLAYSSGQIENIETFMGEVGLDNYRFYGDRMFKAVAAIGAVSVLAGTVLTVLWAALVNIISEITGGIRVVVIEEDPVRGGRP